MLRSRSAFDKFFGVLTSWEDYLAPWISDLVPGSAHEAMLLVGVIEIVAGIAVALAPRFGGLLVAAWLGARMDQTACKPRSWGLHLHP